MYTKRQREMRRCKKIKVNGEQCKGYSKLNSDLCPLHSYSHRRTLPKKHERKAAAARRAKRRAQPQKRFTCVCGAYPFRHRLGSGGCRYPDNPAQTYALVDDEPDYDEAFARDDVEYESAREAEPVADDGRVERSSTELDPLIERQNNDYVKQMEQTWRATTT